MSNSGISFQVISLNPATGSLPLSTCQDANDSLYKATLSHQKRFGGFAALPVGHPAEAAKELDRCVKELGLVGALLPNHDNGRFFDDRKYWSIFDMAEKLDVVLYLHPTNAPAVNGKGGSAASLETYTGNYSDVVAQTLSTFGWGWHAETALHLLRLFSAGVFDEFPKLKIVLGHDGEMIPFMFNRIERYVGRLGQKKRSFRTMWNDNVWITTSGMWSLGPLACLLSTTSAERVLFSVDYPFEGNEDGISFLRKVEESGLVNADDHEGIGFRNPLRLLKGNI